MWARTTSQEAAQETAMIEACATHSNRDLWRFTIRCTRRGLTRDREPVIKREWLICLRNVDSSVWSCRTHLRR